MAATLKTSVVDGLRIMQIANRVMVASRSEEGRWWDVTEGVCGCKGFEHRGRCAHLTATAELFNPRDAEQSDPCICRPEHGIMCAAHGNAIARAQAISTREPERCYVCGEPEIVTRYDDGYRHYRCVPPITITVEPEDEAIPYWPTDGEPCDLPAQCPRCHAEPAVTHHVDGLGVACIRRELFGE